RSNPIAFRIRRSPSPGVGNTASGQIRWPFESGDQSRFLPTCPVARFFYQIETPGSKMTSPDLPVEIWAHIASYGADILGRLLLTIKDLNRYLHDHCMLDDDSPMFQGYLREVYVNYDEARTVI